MQETPITHPGVPKEVYHTLGRKTFWVFVLKNGQAAFTFLIIAIALLILQAQPFLQHFYGHDVTPYVALLAIVCLFLFVAATVITFFVVWFIYMNYKFCLGDDSLKIKRGVLNKEEVAIPYRQIQDVNIARDLSFQMMGLSKIIILSAGHEDEGSGDGQQSGGVLPAIDENLAEWLQAELLRRANIEKVTEVPKGPNAQP